MLTSVLLPSVLWLGQVAGPALAAPRPSGPWPAYARPVREEAPAVIPEDPVIGCIHRPAEVPYDKATIDAAAMRILQVIKLTRLREAEWFETLGPPAESERRLVPRQPPSPEQRRAKRALASAIDRHWRLFEARVYEVRMFQHRPLEGQRAARRAAMAWDALLGLIGRDPEPLPADLSDELAEVDGWVGVLRNAGS